MKEKAEFEVLRNDIWQLIDIKNLKISEYFVHENNVGAVIGYENIIRI